LPVANFTLPSSICLPNGVANFKNTTTISDNSTLSWLWDLGDQSPTVTTKDPSHVYPANGPYNVTLTATSPYGCQDISSQFLNSSAFFDKPIAQFDVTPEALCHGMDNVFTDNSTAPNSSISTWSWNFDDGSPLSSQRNPVKRYKAPGVYEVSLVVKSAQGCVSDTAKTEVTVYLQPVVDAGPSFVVPAGTIVTFRPKVNDSTLSFNWSPSQDFQDPTELTQILVAQKDQIYTLFAEGEGGCVASDTLVIKILNPVTVPNAFSPNGDGINDTWEIPYLKDYPGATVQVFNRYGQQVYFAYGYSRPWDGRLNGTSLPVGTYYYIVTLKNGFAPINGSITIVK
jgi:gliding motility-associated-like protein